MERCDYDRAISFFRAVQPQTRNYVEPQLFAISLVTLFMRVLQRIEITYRL